MTFSRMMMVLGRLGKWRLLSIRLLMLRFAFLKMILRGWILLKTGFFSRCAGFKASSAEIGKCCCEGGGGSAERRDQQA